MDILVAFAMGSVSGALVMAFMTGASVVKREQEAYMEGYLAGQREVNNDLGE